MLDGPETLVLYDRVNAASQRRPLRSENHQASGAPIAGGIAHGFLGVRSRSLFAVAVLVASLAAVVPTPAGGLPPKPPGVQSTKTALERLTVAAAGSLTGYSREEFGGGWATTSNGCDVRERVLIRDGRDIDTGAGCRITRGRWRSIYDGKTLRSASKADIDHVVPLAEAWRSGAGAGARGGASDSPTTCASHNLSL